MIADPGMLALLLLAGVGAGLAGATAGLASLVSYPALLAAGLPPVTANVTNTVAMLGTTAGAAAGARPELSGQRAKLLPLCLITTVGGAAGGVLLLSTPPGAFRVVVPWLIAGASIVLMAGPRLRKMAEHAEQHGLSVRAGLAAFGIGIYGGYFGAAAGVLMKNVATGAANILAAALFAVTGKVVWPAAIAVCAGSLGGAWLGSTVVRHLPATPLRVGIGMAGLGLAVVLGWQALGR